MKELQAIIAAFEQIEQDGTAALATVIEVRGSTYRRPGARMLMTSSGCRIGSISGGCLEADVCDRDREVLVSGKPMVLEYDTTSDADIFYGSGMGCKGLVRVLVERLPPEDPLKCDRLDRRLLSQPANRCFSNHLPCRGRDAGASRK